MPSEIWLVSAPSESEFLGYAGEHTSILYAAAVLWQRIRQGIVRDRDGSQVTPSQVRLFAWRTLAEHVWSEFEAALVSGPPRVLAVGYCTATSDSAVRFAEMAKRHSPHTLVIFGGPHEDGIERICPPAAARFSVVDVSVSGQGEYPLSFLVEELLSHESLDLDVILEHLFNRTAACKSLPGDGTVSFRRPRLETSQSETSSLRGDHPFSLVSIQRHNPFPPEIPRIPRSLLVRDCPGMARGFDVFMRRGTTALTAQIMTERGCGWQCSFCAEWRGQYVRSLEDVIAEISEAEQLGYGAIFFEDSTFLSGFGTESIPRSSFQKQGATRRKFLHDLLDFLRTRGLEWGCQTRVDTVEEDIIWRMRDAGCTYIYFGVESASELQLSDMRKKQTDDQIAVAFDLVRGAGIRIGFSTLYCVPAENDPMVTNENAESVDYTIRFVAEQIARGGVVTVSRNVAAHYPGSLSTYKLVKNQEIDLWESLPWRGPQGIRWPWNRFEDGAGHHPANVTAEVVGRIVRWGEEELGPWLLKSYVHPEVDDRIRPPAGRNVLDFVHYTRTLKVNSNRAAIASTARGTPDVREREFTALEPCFTDALELVLWHALQRRQEPTPQVVVAGMHLLEAVRRISYVRKRDPSGQPTRDILRQRWHPVFHYASTEDLLEELQKIEWSRTLVIALPLVLPETGERLDLFDVDALLAEKNFTGRLVIDVSDGLWNQALDTDLPCRPVDTYWMASPDRLVSTVSGCQVHFAHAAAYTSELPPDLARWATDSLGIGSSEGRADGSSLKRIERVRRYFIRRLRRIAPDLQMRSATWPDSAPHIVTVHMPGVDHLALVEELWRDWAVLATYIGHLDVLRFQIDEVIDEAAIDLFVETLSRVVPRCQLSSTTGQ